MKVAGKSASGALMCCYIGSGNEKSTRHNDGECRILTENMENPNGLVLFEINNTLSLQTVNAGISCV